VLVSCEPATLARDLAHLRWLGLTARHIQPFDMIPQSAAVEVLAVLEPTALTPPIRIVYEDAQLLAVDKPAFLPLTSETEPSLVGWLRQRPGSENALPLHAMGAEASGLCLVARDTDGAAALASRVAKARAHFQVLARGVTRNGGTLRADRPARRRPSDSVVRYRRLRIVGTHSLLRVELQLGEDRQLGRTLAKLSHPVLGDAAAGDAPSNRFFVEKHGLDRAFLHCERIDLPELGSDMAAELAPELRQVLTSLQTAASTRLPVSSTQESRVAPPEVSQPHESRAR
jgi:23S rRNA-/tRNA-specific pseudouridylate synthase